MSYLLYFFTIQANNAPKPIDNASATIPAKKKAKPNNTEPCFIAKNMDASGKRMTSGASNRASPSASNCPLAWCKATSIKCPMLISSLKMYKMHNIQKTIFIITNIT